MFDSLTLREASGQAARIDARSCSDGELLELVGALGCARSFIETAEAHVLAELDARGTTDRVDGIRTVAWAGNTTGGARGPITGRLEVGRLLRDAFTEVDHALCEGALSFDHATALMHATNPRVSAVLAEAQTEIIALAHRSTFAQWKRDVTALATYADLDGPEPDPCTLNELHLAKTLDGRVECNGSFDPANGLALSTAIDAKADELFRRYTRDHALTPDLGIPNRKALRAEALITLIRTALVVEPGSGTLPRAEVTLVLHDSAVTDADGTPLPRAAADVWGCDPELWAVIVNDMGNPVDVGRRHRLATVAQRHAIAVRDGGCTFPGCDAPITWCDHHHIDDWQHGGATDLDNLVALCRHHHGVTHRTGWSMDLDDQQLPHWTTPSGKHLAGQRHHRPLGARPPDRPSNPPPEKQSSYRTLTMARLAHADTQQCTYDDHQRLLRHHDRRR